MAEPAAVRNLTAAARCALGLRAPLAAAVRAVAATLRTAHGRVRPAQVRRKGPGDFVTALDLRSERRLRRDLRSLLPAAGFLGEETPPHQLDRDWLWVVDPIDGTSNFARGLPHYAVAVALLWRGQPVLAAIHCAPEQALYLAVHGRGAVREGRRLRLRPGQSGDAAIYGCQYHRGQQQLAFLSRLQGQGARIRTLGSTVTQLADVAMGRLDANVQEQGRIWDIAAAGLVLVEAGGRFTDWTGRPVFPFRDLTVGHTATVGASPAAHRRVLRLLAP